MAETSDRVETGWAHLLSGSRAHISANPDLWGYSRDLLGSGSQSGMKTNDS